MLDNLSAPSALDWLASWADLVNRRILERLLRLSGNDDPEQLSSKGDDGSFGS